MLQTNVSVDVQKNSESVAAHYFLDHDVWPLTPDLSLTDSLYFMQFFLGTLMFGSSNHRVLISLHKLQIFMRINGFEIENIIIYILAFESNC